MTERYEAVWKMADSTVTIYRDFVGVAYQPPEMLAGGGPIDSEEEAVKYVAQFGYTPLHEWFGSGFIRWVTLLPTPTEQSVQQKV